MLEDSGIKVSHVREPGGTPLAEKMRALVLEERNERISSLSMLYAMQCMRMQLQQEIIKPSLKAGVPVLSDRDIATSYAYQVTGLTEEKVFHTLFDSDQYVHPDLFIFLESDYPTFLKRLTNDGAVHPIEEMDEITYAQRYRRYQDYIALLKDRCPDTTFICIPADTRERDYAFIVKEIVRSKQAELLGGVQIL